MAEQELRLLVKANRGADGMQFALGAASLQFNQLMPSIDASSAGLAAAARPVWHLAAAQTPLNPWDACHRLLVGTQPPRYLARVVGEQGAGVRTRRHPSCAAHQCITPLSAPS